MPNAHLADVANRDGALHARTVDWDPFFVCEGLEMATSPGQVVVIRLRGDRAGDGDLFWTGEPTGPMGGLSESRKACFQVPGDGAWHDIAIYLFWQSAGVLRKLRLDLYQDATFDIASIRILDWGAGAAPSTQTSWTMEMLGVKAGAATVNLELHGVPGWPDVVAPSVWTISSSLQLGHAPTVPPISTSFILAWKMV